MKPVTYSLNKKEALCWLISAAVFVAFISLGITLHEKVLNGAYEKQRMYQTAIKTTDQEEFNYSVDTKQGNILTYGTFYFLDFVKFPEMNKSFSYVHKEKERYTRHEYEDCTTDDKGNEHCTTRVEYSWDHVDSESLSGKKVKFFDREYQTSQFAFGSIRSIKASEIINGADDRYWYPDRKTTLFGRDKEGSIRYGYSVRDSSVTGSIFVSTYNDFKPAEGHIIQVSRDSIDNRVKNVVTEAKWLSGGFIAVWTIVTIGATVWVTYMWMEKSRLI